MNHIINLRGERDVIRLRNPTKDKRAFRRMLTSADLPENQGGYRPAENNYIVMDSAPKYACFAGYILSFRVMLTRLWTTRPRGKMQTECTSKTSHLRLKCEVSRTEKKVQECDYVLGSLTTFQRRKEWICESRCRQVSVRLHVFVGFFCP